MLAIACAAVAWLLTPAWFGPAQRVVASYDIFALALCGLAWNFLQTSDLTQVKARAASHDPGRNVDLGLALACVLAGLLSAIVIFGDRSHLHTDFEKALTYSLGGIAVVTGWCIIHTLFSFRYAHMYYMHDDEDSDSRRGLRFPDTEEPGDSDFAYFSFGIGMTFQVSDVAVVDGGVRRTVLAHSLISFAYNTMIVALCINLISGIIG